MVVRLVLLSLAWAVAAAAIVALPEDLGLALVSGAALFGFSLYAFRQRRALRRLHSALEGVAHDQRRGAASMSAGYSATAKELLASIDSQRTQLSDVVDELGERVGKALEAKPSRTELHRLHDDALLGVDRSFRQLEALLGLHSLFQVRSALPPSRKWAASPDILLYLSSLVLEFRPRLVLELGSGLSTVWLGYALERSGSGGRIISLDHDAGFADRTRRLLAQHELTRVAEVRHAPLAAVELHGETWPWYEPAALGDVELCDLIFVDGPPGATRPLARYPALPLLGRKLSENGMLVLDDCVRQDEKDTVARWRESHPEWTVVALDHEKGTTVVARNAR